MEKGWKGYIIGARMGPSPLELVIVDWLIDRRISQSLAIQCNSNSQLRAIVFFIPKINYKFSVPLIIHQQLKAIKHHIIPFF